MPDVLRFLGTVIVMALAGAGITTCLRLPTEPVTRVLMGPVFALALWAIVLGDAVWLGYPVHVFVGWLWGATVLMAVIGIWQLHRDEFLSSRAWRPELWSFLAVMVSPIAVMARYFWGGLAEYPGSGLPDGWAYVAYGQFLWTFPAGAEGGLAPLYQYASTLPAMRSTAATALDMLSALRAPGIAQSGSGLLQGVGLAAYGAAVAAFCRRSGLCPRLAAAAVAITVVSGWILNVIWANNFDNLLALGYVPALAVLAADPRVDSPGWWLGAAWLTAGLLRTYPELASIVFGLAAAIAACIVAGSRSHLTRRVALLACAGTSFLLLLMPAWKDFVHLLQTQVTAATAVEASRPGEGLFTGLTIPRHVLAGWWGLGSEHAYERWLVPRTAIAMALILLAAAGAWTLAREKRAAWLLWLTLPLGLAAYLAAATGYSYGAYKAILVGWWFVVFLVMRGALTLAPTPAGAAGVVVWLLVLTLPATAIARVLVAPVSRSFRMPRPASMAFFRQVTDIEAIVAAEPLLVAVQEEEACEWAVYFLRDTTMRLVERDRYMTPKRSTMTRSTPVDLDRVRWVLTDGVGAGVRPVGLSAASELRWRGGPYALWRTGEGEARTVETAFLAGH
jgi:hypothetical protein